MQDRLPAGDFKSINKSSENLFKYGHVQCIRLAVTNGSLYVNSKCMRKDRMYCVHMALSSNSSDIISACGCPAGQGPTGSCKHIGALLYALPEYIRFKTSPTYQTPTDTLQVWNRPHACKVEPISVSQLGKRCHKLLPSNVHSKGFQVIYDPRPLGL